MTENFRFHAFFLFILAFSLTVSVASPALAHRLNVFVLPEDGRVTGEAYFNDGAPALNCPIRLVAPDGTVLGEGRTDSEGAFSLPLPAGSDSPLTVVVEGDMGHRGETTLNPVTQKEPLVSTVPAPDTAASSAPALTSGEVQSLVRDAVRLEVAPLKDELFRLNQRLSRPGLTEIVGGLGYIVGLVGVILIVGSRKNNG